MLEVSQGHLYNGGGIQNVYNTGSVSASKGVAGGIVGAFRYGTLKNVYNAGLVEASTKGGVAGRLEWTGGNKTLQNVFYSAEYEAIGNLNGCTIQNGHGNRQNFRRAESSHQRRPGRQLCSRYQWDQQRISGAGMAERDCEIRRSGKGRQRMAGRSGQGCAAAEGRRISDRNAGRTGMVCRKSCTGFH